MTASAATLSFLPSTRLRPRPIPTEADILLPTKARLRASRDFQAVFSRGKSHADPLLVLYALPRPDGATRFGFSVGRKVGGAAQRNRVKRLLREAARGLMLETSPGHDFVVVARARAKDASFADVCASMRRLMGRLPGE